MDSMILQFVAVDESGSVIGITTEMDGIPILSDINLSAPFDEIGAPLYKIVDGELKKRTASEINKSRKALS